MNKLYTFCCWCMMLLLTVTYTRAQETSGRLDGRILDEKGRPVPGVTVQAVHTPSGTRYGTIAGADGRYHLTGLRVGGPYQVLATMMGMTPQVKDGITIQLGAPQLLNFVMADGKKQLSEVVVKGARTARANSTGAGQNISRLQVSNTPTIARSIQDITKLVPQGSKDNSFGGTNFRYNNVTIDGAINNDAIGFSPSMGGITGTSGMPGSSTGTNPVSLDAIEDMQVYLAPFDVKIGNFTGGSVNAVTRSGTNQFSGAVYAYGRNAAITGKDKAGSLGKMNNDFYDYQAGLRLGFPLIKNKLFFFTNEEITGRQLPSQLTTGVRETAHILSVKDAGDIRNATIQRYGNAFDPGNAGMFNATSSSSKFFNRLDWNINEQHQLSVRNNTIFSHAILMDRDQQDFRFSSMAYKQTNNQTSTVAELKTRFNRQLANSLVVGYTVVNDKRDPESSPNLPQVQIMGRTPGTTIYLGTDREAAIFNMQQRTWEITDNLTWYKGKHTFLAGTHNELYRIRYGFVNSWNGRVDYLSINDYLNNTPYRVRGSYNYTSNDRNYILDHPEAEFNVNMFSAYIQDEIQLTDKLKLVPGLRADYTMLPEKPVLSDKTRNATTDGFLGNTYDYTPLNRITNHFFGKVQVSPRLGFRYDWNGDQSLILRGGIGMFTGRIPFAWLAYAYYNNGDAYGSFDQKADQKAFVPGTDPLKPGNNGIADFIAQNGAVINNKNSGKTQVDVIDNNFVMPKVLRASLAVDYTTLNGYRFTVEGMYTKSLKDVIFKQVNIKDDPRYYGFDSLRRQPIFGGAVDPRFSNAYELSNTSKGYRYSLTASVNKSFNMGLSGNVAYTYGESKDVSNGIRNSMESNWQLNQALHPNNPGLAYSNFDIRHRIVVNVNYRKAWTPKWVSSLSVLVTAQSGSPFTYGIVNNSIQGLPQQVSLVYIPKEQEAIGYFQDYTDASGREITAKDQAAAFNTYVDGNAYLRSRRGNFTERNMGRTPWNTQADLHFAQEFHFSEKAGSSYLTFTLDIMNLTNLLNKDWGRSYFSPNTFNSTASVGLTPVFPGRQSKDNNPVYTFGDPGTPYSIDFFGSRYQLQMGMRYSF
ncbi:MAG TPA: carboxypeptidase regulatory-like domain-containing protein [Chitinophaga sp.]|uniref:TonB-dependent receptor n=1 Tax=Chitinophaga sp. TaxID=1869181 RepID=UPI002BD25214|nr:carboxypeptidase regulatory-like domain-containing protein [Chitinophaga sp.]HVI44037.1 carboxypeptidase regulatory-like domain-containing protein [Chitinophaga sp.]